jgi:hypothetical protein
MKDPVCTWQCHRAASNWPNVPPCPAEGCALAIERGKQTASLQWGAGALHIKPIPAHYAAQPPAKSKVVSAAALDELVSAAEHVAEQLRYDPGMRMDTDRLFRALEAVKK